MTAPGTPTRRYKRTKAEREIDLSKAEFVQRDVCFNCGVRRDRHDRLGCRRWRGGA